MWEEGKASAEAPKQGMCEFAPQRKLGEDSSLLTANRRHGKPGFSKSKVSTSFLPFASILTCTLCK
jgi:hypothetical protein